ncbi:MAG TPA: HAMP domain-containing sensor histidine kinase [Solirubrobacteraceae bacterium]
MGLRGLRPRVTLLIVAVVVVCVGIAFVAVYAGTASELSKRSRQDLRADMVALEQVVTTGSSRPSAVAARARAYLAHQPFRPTSHVLFVVPVGRPAVSNEPELLGLSPPDEGESTGQQREENRAAHAFLTAPPGYSFHQLPDGGRIELLVRVARSRGRVVARLGVGEPTVPTDRAKRAVRDEFLLAGALAVLAALSAGFAVASRVAAPLRRMARVAARVDAGDLGPRMEIAARHDEVRVLAEAFDHMLDRLEAAFDRQTAFVADASHELRTPLTVIRGQLEVLALADEPDAAEVRRVEKLVALEVQRMSRLVEDMLVLAQAGEEGFLRPGVIALRPFLTDLVRGLADASPRRLELGAIPELLVEADEGRLAQALRNLLRNAIAHTAENGVVELSVQAEGGRLRFVVDDDGPGIPVQQRAAIFDRFHRLDGGRSRDAGGAGLGLAIVSAIASAHGGRVWAQAAPAGGARMVLEIPLRPGPVRA